MVGGGFVFPSPHLSIVKYLASVHVLDAGLHLVLVSGGDIYGCTYFLLSIELAGVGGDVGSEILFNTESRECLFLFKGGGDESFVAEVFEDSIDVLIGVANVVVLQLLDVGWVDDVLCQAVDGDSVDGLLFSVLLLINFVFRVEFCLVDEGGVVGESVWGEWWCVQAVGCDSVVASDRSKSPLVDDEGEASVATSPHCCFHRGCKFCALLLEVVYRCVGGLSDNLAEGNCGDFCSYRLAHG